MEWPANQQQQQILSRYQVRHVVVAVILSGISLALWLTGHTPGWQPYAAGLLLSTFYLLLAVGNWRGSHWIGLLTFCVVVLAIFWNPARPFTVVLALALILLRSLSMNEAGAESLMEESNG